MRKFWRGVLNKVQIDQRKKTIGEILKAERARKKISLDEAMAATRIQKRFLKSLEDGNVSYIPNRVVARGFLKLYADYLGVDQKKAIAEFDAEYGTESDDSKPGITKALEGNRNEMVNGSYFKYGFYMVVVVALLLSVYFALSGYTLEDRSSAPSAGIENVE
jgi:cytoskeletal protein RodZ